VQRTRSIREEVVMGIIAEMPKGPFCQSCGIPLETPDQFGTDAEGMRINDYCVYCFRDGAFTEPNISREQMIAKVADLLARIEEMPEAQAQKKAESTIPNLKRWDHMHVPGEFRES
jgi:hypothetical protein